MSEKVSVMISTKDIEERIKSIAEQINEDYKGKTITLVCILKGGAFFTTALAKYIEVPVCFEFMSVSSYGDATESSGKVDIIKDVDSPIEGKDILIIEDIIDSGRTLACLMKIFEERKPASLRLCTLLDKPDRRVADVHVDYTGFKIADKFVVGYGLDYKQLYRNLPYIGTVEID